MTSDNTPHRFAGLRDPSKQIIVLQHQRFIVSGGSLHQERLNTSNMVKILLIGETGSGKSTFINYVTNYFKRGTLHNLKVAIPSLFHPEVTENFGHSEHNVHDTTQSKTDSCNQYMFTDGNTQYLFLDTPGLSDTRGHDQDKINLDKIINAVEVLAGLTAVIIVVNGAIARLTVNLQNVIAQLRGNLPDIVMDNVIVVLTNTARHTTTFTLEALRLNGNVYPYYMQNSAFSTDPTKWTSTVMQHLQCEWNEAMNEIKSMIATLNTFKTKSVAAFINMKDIRNEIKALMHAARLEVCQIQRMQDELEMFEAGLKQASTDAVTYKDYTKERIVEKIELVDAPYHSTLCKNCNNVCHDKCGLDETTVDGAQIFQQCWAMKNGNCIQCKHRCSYTAHYHAKKTVKISQQTLKDVLADIKSRYDAASNDSVNIQKKITNTADAKRLLEKALHQKKIEIIDRCNELRRICSGFNLASELKALIHQLEIESSMLRNIDAKKQAEIFIRSLKEFCDLIEKDQDEQQKRSFDNGKMNIIRSERSIEDQTQMYRPPSEATIVNQNSSTAVTKSESYASEDVLKQIREMSGGSLTNNERHESENTPQENADSSGKPKPSKSELPHAYVNNSEPNFEEIKKLSISELLIRHRDCEDQRTANSILRELKQRSYGKSMPNLTDPADLTTYVAITNYYNPLDKTSLEKRYEDLKKQVCDITEPDILDIEKVPSILLFEIAAVYKLIQQKFSTSLNPGVIYSPVHFQPPVLFSPQQQQPPFNPQSYQQTQSIGGTPYLPTSRYDFPPQVSTVSHHPPYSAYDRESFQPVSVQHAQFIQPGLQYHMHAGNFGDQYRRSPIYTDYERFRHQGADTHLYHSDLNSSPRFTAFHHSNQYHHAQAQQQQVYQNVHRPSPILPSSMSPPSTFPSSASHLSQTFDRMRVSSSFRPIEPSSYHADTVSSRNHSSSGYSESTSGTNSVIGLPFELSVDELRNYTDIQLYAAFDDAMQKKNRAHEHAIYEELQRRCYGDHPLLITEKPVLFEENCRKLQGTSIDDMKKFLSDVHHKIHRYLTNGNAADLNKIPVELIVEAAALNHLIQIKTARA